MSSEQLTLFAEDSLANHTVLPGSDEARQMTVTSGRNIAALLTLSGPLGLLVKTCLESEQLSSTACYLTWKTSATPGGRLVFRLAPSMPSTGANEFSFWPTPTSRDWKDGTAEAVKNVPINSLLGRAVHFWPTPTQRDGMGGPGNSGRDGGDNLRTAIGGSLNPEWVEWLMGFPVGWTDLEH